MLTAQIGTRHGTIVKVHVHRWGLDVLIHYIGAHNSTRGLCGIWNSFNNDDLTIDDGFGTTADPNLPWAVDVFISTWR